MCIIYTTGVFMEIIYVLLPTIASLYFMVQASKYRKYYKGLQVAYSTVSSDYVKYNRQAQQLSRRNAQLLERLAIYEGK